MKRIVPRIMNKSIFQKSLLSFTKVLSVASILFLSIFGYGISAAQATTVVTSSPAANAVITTAPNIVSIQSDVALSNAGSTISVLDPSGSEVDDRSISINGNTIAVGMQNLTLSGNYTVNYALFSDADQPLTGSYTFTFNSPGTVTTPTKPDNGNNNQTKIPTTNTNNQSSNKGLQSATAGNAFVYTLIGAAFLVAILLLWYTYFLIKKRNR